MATLPQRSEFLAACLRDLDAAGIPFCISRNHHEFWNDGSSDVDMIVPPELADNAACVIANSAERNGYRIALRTRFDNLCLAFHSPGARFVRIDLDTAVRWHTRTLASAEEVLNRRTIRDGLPIPSPEHETLILLCQGAWSGVVKAAYRDRIRNLIAATADHQRVTSLLNTRFGFDATDLSELLSSGLTEKLRHTLKKGQNQHRSSNFLRFLTRTLTRLIHPPGIVVSWQDPDKQCVEKTSAQMELVFPSAKSSSPSDPFLKSMLSVFRGGIWWNGTSHLLPLWVGKKRVFQCGNGVILHPSSGESAPTNEAADFIGRKLADNMSKPT